MTIILYERDPAWPDQWRRHCESRDRQRFQRANRMTRLTAAALAIACAVCYGLLLGAAL